MAGRVKNWWNSLWDDDDTVYEDESSFDDDIWADLGIDPNSDPDTWTDPITPTEDPYGIGSFFNTYDSGDWGGDTVDFGEEGFNFGDFDVDSYLDSTLNFDLGWGDDDYNEETADDYWGLGEGYDDAFDFGSLGDDEDTAFNDFLRNFDFAGDADWAGGIGDLFDFGGLGEGGDPNDRFDIGAGYDDAFGDIFGGDTKDPEYSILNNLLFGQEYGGTGGNGEGTTPAASGIFSGKRMPKLAGFLNRILGGANTAVGTAGSGLAGLLNSRLGQLAMLNYMKNKNKDIMDIPVGYGDGGGGGGDGSPIDYRVFNLQPALMPGVAYANVAPPVPPPEMRGGGLGDVTLAKLEPGEFVVTKKAVDNVGAQNLYKMMKQWEGRG